MYDFTAFLDPHVWAVTKIPNITKCQHFVLSDEEIGIVRCYAKTLDDVPVEVRMLQPAWRDYFVPATALANLSAYVPRIERVAVAAARASTILDIHEKFLSPVDRARVGVAGYRGFDTGAKGAEAVPEPVVVGAPAAAAAPAGAVCACVARRGANLLLHYLIVHIRATALRRIQLRQSSRYEFTFARRRGICHALHAHRHQPQFSTPTPPWVLVARVLVARVLVARVPVARVLVARVLNASAARVPVPTATTRRRVPPSPSRTNRSAGGPASLASGVDGDVDSVCSNTAYATRTR